MPLPGQGDQRARQAAIQRPRRERRDARRLDAAVERLVIGRESLVVRAVARLVDVQDRHAPGPAAPWSRPTRLVAWMYSALVFGCPKTTIRPSRVMSRPTEIMFVAMATSTRSFSQNGRASRRLASATLSVLTRRGQLDRLVGDLAVLEQALRLADPLAAAVAGQPVADFVLDDPPGAAQLAQAVEVAEQRHVRDRPDLSGRLLAAELGVGLLCRGQERQVDPQHDHLGAAALGGDADVQPGVALLRRMDLGKERIPAIRAGRREDVHLPAVEQRADLVLGPADRGRRGHDLRPDLRVRPRLWLHSSSRAVSYSPTIVPSGPEIRCSSSWMTRSGGSRSPPGSGLPTCRVARAVEAVLVVALHAAEERAHLAGPRHGRELVHRGDHEAGQPAVDRLIDRQDRQRPLSRLKSQCRLTQVTRRSVGSSGFGTSWNEFVLNFVPHQGHSSSGIGDGLRSSFLKAIVLARAESGLLSPLRPIRSAWPPCRPTGRSRTATRRVSPRPSAVPVPRRRSASPRGRADRGSAAAACSA